MLEYFFRFSKSAFRYEALQEYDVHFEKEAYQQFHNTGQLPAHFNQEWHSIIATALKRGAKMQRVRLLSFPLSPYLQYELRAYQESLLHWEEIRYITKNELSWCKDFWIFDDEVVLEMNYSSNWTFLWFKELTDQHALFHTYLAHKYRLLSSSQPIAPLLSKT